MSENNLYESQQTLFALKDQNVRRVHIVGGPGSGKTTLAQKIGHYLRAPVYELDKIAFEGPDFTDRPLSLRLAEIDHIAAQSGWITEGMWLGWTDKLLWICDIVIWLDCVSWSVAAQRIVMRFARNGFKGVMYQSGLRKFTRIQDYKRNLMQLIGVFRSSWLYYHNETAEGPTDFLDSYAYSRSFTERYLSPYHQKLIHIRSKSDVDVLLENFTRREAMPSHSMVLNIGQEFLVSIIINNYNYGGFLKHAIESALHQKYPAVEIIVVDDGSTDNSQEVILGYGNKIIPIFKENGGQASAINAGFCQSHGDIIIFLDADDMLRTDTVQLIVDAYRKKPEAAKIMYRLEVIDANGQPTRELRPHPHLPMHNGALHEHVLTFPFDMIWMATSGNSFPASVLKQILPIPEKEYPILADYYLSFMAPLFGPVVFLQDIGGYYRIHGHNNHENTERIDLAKIRRILNYSTITWVYIQKFAEKLHLEGRPAPGSELLSVSSISERLISLKLSRSDHPVPGDTSWRLFRLGVAAAVRRFDVTWLMRVIFIIWFIVLALAPAQITRWLAVQFFLPDKRLLLNPLLRLLHRRQ